MMESEMYPSAEHGDMSRLQLGKHHDPGVILGRHRNGSSDVARSLVPDAVSVVIVETNREMRKIGETDIFEWLAPKGKVPERFQIKWKDRSGREFQRYEPYCFPPQISEYDLHLFSEGTHRKVYQFLGAHFYCIDGVDGVLFATWAPNAERVSVIGDFNNWDGRCHPMRNRGHSGVWEIFIPGVTPGTRYKFELRTQDQGELLVKADPYGYQFELRPATASIVAAKSTFTWSDGDWLEKRDKQDCLHTPLSIYEVHLGSWRRSNNGDMQNYRELAHELVAYVKQLGFTHIELLPITEHPLDASWGYQTTGYYAPTSRYGNPDDFRYLIDYCHCNGIGVILDWVAGHFPKDAHGMTRFDGTALYEHEDPKKGEHREWGTLIFNYGRHEVRNFLISNALYWINEFHIDGLRVDAVASMLYLDYSRQAGEWIPNEHGGNENLEAISFLREINEQVLSHHPGTIMIAEESTSWPQVTRPPWVGGLGFSMKWNMGWMHDTLEYIRKDPIHRHYHHEDLTFGMLYAFHENFVLPFSHDEVVHGKGSILGRMPGDDWQRFANLRLLYTYLFTYPGKKLLFMGNEIGQWQEWDHDKSLDWDLLNYPAHRGVQSIVADLNHLYTTTPALYVHDFEPGGFEWIDCHDASQSVLSYARKHDTNTFLIILNFTPVPRHHYRLGVDHPGTYREVLNSDSSYYNGSNAGNAGELRTQLNQWMGRHFSIELTLPPLAGLVLEHMG